MKYKSFPVSGILIVTACLIIITAGCASGPKEIPDVGELKVSLFQLVEGKMAKEVVGSYVALISNGRYKRCGIKLDEVFEQISQPSVSVMDDETADGMAQLIHQDDFFGLPGIRPEQINLEDFKRVDFRDKIIIIEFNGVAHAVSYEALPARLRPVFSELSHAVFLAMETTDVKPVIQEQDWRELLDEYLRTRPK
ncbi:MAG: hypothetical protein WC980_09795 [Candidatus Brocadiia bacterium]